MRRSGMARGASLALVVGLAFAASSRASADAVTGYVFTDGFEGALAWRPFEELVAGDTCANASSDPSIVSETSSRAHSGSASLQIRTNPADAPNFDNHVIAQQELFAAGQTGRWKFDVFVYVDATAILDTQTGPELSLQSTRQIEAGVWRTMTGGVQYSGSQWVPTKWRVWGATGSNGTESETVDWLETTGPTLSETGWYELSYEIDYDALAYVGASITSPSGVASTIGVAGTALAREMKFSESAFWATMEAQNLWDCNGDGVAWQSTVDYDDVTITQTSGVLARPPTATNTSPTTGMGQASTFAIPASDPDGNLDWSTVTFPVPPTHGTVTVDATAGTMTYTPNAGFAGGDGFKFQVCDRTLLCASAWIGMGVQNHAPVAVDTSVTTPANTPITLALPISDVDGNLDFSTTTELVPPSSGTTSYDDAAGTVTYTPAPNVTGSAGFKFRVCDTYAACAEAWISVTID